MPIMDPTLLPDNQAVLAQNTWLYSGALIGMPTPQGLHTCGRPDIAKVYRIPLSYNQPGFSPGDHWLEFESSDTDVVRSPVFGETWDRYYSAAAHRAPLYNTRDRIFADEPAFLLGVPPPPTAPVVNAEDGTTDLMVSRAYVYTWVSEYKEEGPPSPPTLVNADSGDTWKIIAFEPPAVDQGTRRNLTHLRIYRTVTSTSAIPDYYFVEELALTGGPGPVFYTDKWTDEQITSRIILESNDWAGPLPDLHGLCMMPNGIMAGWRESELWFSEPYRPHAWPGKYALMTEYPVVGLGIWGQTLVICTQGFPSTATGIHPSQISTSKLTLFEPCISRGSIVSAPEGVYYTSPSGLVLVNTGAQVVTSKLISKGQWQKMVPPNRFRAARLSTGYYGSGAKIGGAFQADLIQTDAFQPTELAGSQDGLMFDMSDARLALTRLLAASPVYGLQNDAWTDELFVIRDGIVYWLNMADESILTLPVVWTSKLFQTEKPRSYAAFKVDFVVPPGTPAKPAVRTASPTALGPTMWGIIKFYCDHPAEDTLLASFELRESAELLHLPADRKYDYFYFVLETRVRVRRVMISETAKELAAA